MVHYNKGKVNINSPNYGNLTRFLENICKHCLSNSKAQAFVVIPNITMAWYTTPDDLKRGLTVIRLWRSYEVNSGLSGSLQYLQKHLPAMCQIHPNKGVLLVILTDELSMDEAKQSAHILSDVQATYHAWIGIASVNDSGSIGRDAWTKFISPHINPKVNMTVLTYQDLLIPAEQNKFSSMFYPCESMFDGLGTLFAIFEPCFTLRDF